MDNTLVSLLGFQDGFTCEGLLTVLIWFILFKSFIVVFRALSDSIR